MPRNQLGRLTTSQIRDLELWLRGQKESSRVRNTAYHLMGRRGRLPSVEHAIDWSVREALVLERASVHRKARELGAPTARRVTVPASWKYDLPAAVLEQLALRALESMDSRRRSEFLETCETTDWPEPKRGLFANLDGLTPILEISDPADVLFGLSVLERVPPDPERTTRRRIIASAKGRGRGWVGTWLDRLERAGLIVSRRPAEMGEEDEQFRGRREDLLTRTARGDRVLSQGGAR